MRRLATVVIVMTAVLIAHCHSRPASAQAGTSKQEAEDFELVKRIGSRRAWQIFLQTYPDGPYAERAQAELGKLPNLEGMSRPNWGDDKFIKQHIDRQRQ